MINIQTLSSGSKGNCYIIDDGKTKLMLDCGIPWRKIQQRLNFATYDIESCLLTHAHGDHIKALQDVLKAGIDTYASAGCWNQSGVNMTHRGHIIEAKEQFTIGTWTILPFEVEHDCDEPLGYLLVNGEGEKLLFATDTCYLRYRFSGLTHLLIECNHALDIIKANVEAGRLSVDLKNRIIQTHFSLANVKEFLKASDLSKVKEIHLIHLSDDNSDEARFKREIRELTGKPVYIAQ